jgi:hypothetical protein
MIRIIIGIIIVAIIIWTLIDLKKQWGNKGNF